MPPTKEFLDALIFIDTNIFLDFYRIRKRGVSMQYLEEIVKHKDLIITNSQIEMEFKRNRQTVVLDSIGEIKKVANSSLSFPEIIANTQASKMIKKKKKEIESKKKVLKKKVENILKNPGDHDPVYKSLQKLWKNRSPYNLNRENEQRHRIRRLAGKRFILGYPPRKRSDNSIGDAIHWEWIIKCAELSGKGIIVVSRDADFGTHYEGESFLDDWLLKEFKERISRRRKIVFTDKLTKAFKLVAIPVTEEMIKEESKVIKYGSSQYDVSSLSEVLRKIQKTQDLISSIKPMLDIPNYKPLFDMSSLIPSRLDLSQYRRYYDEEE